LVSGVVGGPALLKEWDERDEIEGVVEDKDGDGYDNAGVQGGSRKMSKVVQSNKEKIPGSHTSTHPLYCASCRTQKVYTRLTKDKPQSPLFPPPHLLQPTWHDHNRSPPKCKAMYQ